MVVYLLRHAIAAERDATTYPDDDERPLTEEGIRKMQDAALGVTTVVDRADLILASPLIRTRQTADTVARALDRKARVEASGVRAGTGDDRRAAS